MHNLNRTFAILAGVTALAAAGGFVVVLVAPGVVGIGPADQSEALGFLATMTAVMVGLVLVQWWVADFLKDLPRPPRMGDRLEDARAAMAHASSMMTGMSSDASATAALLTTGYLAAATVVETRSTGTFVNFEPLVEVHLEVEVDGNVPYLVTKRLVLSPVHLAVVHPGARLAVRVAADDRQQVAIDWSLRGASA